MLEPCLLPSTPLPHTEARDRIAGLPLVTREVMDGLLPELRAYRILHHGD